MQKTLYRDAMMFKDIKYQQKSIEERTKLDSETVKIYEQMYRLPPQKYADPDDDPNPASVKTHYWTHKNMGLKRLVEGNNK